MNVLVLNPGGNSLKLQVVSCSPDLRFASDGRNLTSLILDAIGKEPSLSILDGKKTIRQEPVQAANYEEAAEALLARLHADDAVPKRDIHCVGIRVVHGGEHFSQAVELTEEVEKEIKDLERLAPLHNKSSLELLGPLRRALPDTPLYAVFDTAFHRTIPEVASRYAIPVDLSDKHGIRRFGFHGTSHRYMLEKSARMLGRNPADLRLVTMHLESGCSVTAIEHGRSVDNTMGFTPLEGLMMGTRSGDVDPAIISFLMREEHMQVEEVLNLLNKKSGLLAISGKSLDTRVLIKDYGQDPRVTLALDMFCYRLSKAVGASLSALKGADALVFGGGIGENTPLVRERVCASVGWAGLKMDPAANQALIDREGSLTTSDSNLQAMVVLTEEGLQIAYECAQALSAPAAN
jgi:acetate kinase